jgi:hypothetical protein
MVFWKRTKRVRRTLSGVELMAVPMLVLPFGGLKTDLNDP